MSKLLSSFFDQFRIEQDIPAERRSSLGRSSSPGVSARGALVLSVGALLLGACGGSSPPAIGGSAGGGGSGQGGSSQCTMGDEGCPCFPNSTCNGALACLSSLCVRDTGAGGGAGASAGGSSSGTGGGSGTGAGGSSTGGGSGTGAGGSSTGGGAGAGAAGAAGAPTNIYLVDDFADCDNNIIEVDARKGVWYDLSSTPQNFSYGPPPNASWNDQSCGVFLTGKCPSCAAAGIGVILAPGAYDLTRFSGVRVTYESEATLNVRIKATNGSTYTYSTSSAITPNGTESVVSVPFSSFTPDADFQGLARADEIHFALSTADKTNGFGLGIHRLELLP